MLAADMNGLYRILNAAKLTENKQELRAIGVVLCSLVPHPKDLYAFHQDEYICPVEKFRVIDVLKRVKYLGYDDSR